MDQFFKNHKLPQLNQYKRENLNSSIAIEEFNSQGKNLPKKESPGPDGFTGEFYQMFKELTLILYNLFQKIEIEGTTHSSF